jgi:biotin transport system substrate-specific component
MSPKRAFSVRRTALIASMAAVLCVCAWITVPFAVPFTMQTFGVFAALLLLGGRDGTVAVGLYLLLGCVGLPVFSGFRGGAAHLFGPTGGYLLGFVFTGLAHMVLEPVTQRGKPAARIALCFAEHVLCYLVGTLWFVAVSGSQGTHYGFFAALTLCVAPYVLPDLGKIALADFVSRRVGKRFHK